MHGNYILPDHNGTVSLNGRIRPIVVWRWCQFAAHPSCQKKLTSLWYGVGHFDKLLQRRSKLVQITIVACIVIFYPVLSLIYIIAPNSLVSLYYYNIYTSLFTKNVESLLVVYILQAAENPSPY